MKIEPIIFENFEDANVLLDACQECIEHNGVVTVANVFDLGGMPSEDPEEYDWGWNDISNVEIEATGTDGPSGYFLRFPDPKPVKDLYAKSDQKVKADNGKPQLTLVPRKIIFDIAKVREYGNGKYPEGGPDNWKKVEKERYRDAAFRHFLAYLDDPTGMDEESGLPHLSHLATNIAFLCEMEGL